VLLCALPGELFSDDDLYMTDAGLVVMETTNHIYNPDVFKAGRIMANHLGFGIRFGLAVCWGVAGGMTATGQDMFSGL
jgi:hypothetical protein